jgi:hypothetical protein
VKLHVHTLIGVCNVEVAFLAAWRPCNSCEDLVLYVDENARTDTRFICGKCMERAERQLASLMEMDRVRGVDEAN